MAEAAGLAFSIVSLYNAALDLIERVDAYKDFGIESQTLLARYSASKLRLQKWSKIVGRRDGKMIDTPDPRLNEAQTASVVGHILTCLKQLFDQAEKQSAPIKTPARQLSGGLLEWPAAPDGRRHDSDSHTTASRVRISWATGGQSKFTKVVQSFESLVNLLYDIVPLEEKGTLGELTCECLPSF